jgi:hypothetical protein
VYLMVLASMPCGAVVAVASCRSFDDYVSYFRRGVQLRLRSTTIRVVPS